MKNAYLHSRTLRLPATFWLLVVFLAGCTPADRRPASTVTVPLLQTAVPTEVATVNTGMAGVTPVVTPRGPNLVASDPNTVKLQSGQLQLVEFFRFT